MLTHAEQRLMADKALFIKERLALISLCKPELLSNAGEAAPELFKKWSQNAGGNGGQRAFEQRLLVDGLDYGQAQTLFADPPLSVNDVALPDWVSIIQGILTKLTNKGKSSSNEPKEATDPLFLAFRPFIEYADLLLREALANQGCDNGILADKAYDDLLIALTRRLQHLSRKVHQAHLTAYANQRNPLQAIMGKRLTPEAIAPYAEAYTLELLAGGWKSLLLAYPVMARRLAETVDDWVRNHAAFLSRLKQDRTELERVFHAGNRLGNVTNIQTELSDPHNGGQTVMIVAFEDGCKIVYKPRSGAIDHAWSTWVGWLESAGLPCFRVPDVVDFGTHSWMEYIEPLPLTNELEAELYYERAGVLLCQLYVLGGDDFHMENVIAHGSHPVLIDTETLLMPRVKPFALSGEGMNSQQKAHNILIDSVLRTGLLPIWVTDGKGNAADWSGLTGDSRGGANLPMLNGKKLTVAAYKAAFVQGFERAYRFLLEHREFLLQDQSPLREFERIQIRTLLRNTQVYGDLLERVHHPNYLRNGLAFSVEVERLAAAYLLHDAGEQFQPLWHCFLAERDALEHGDIPIFYAFGGDYALRDSGSVLHAGFFMETAVERCFSTLSKMNLRDLKSQLDYIQASLSMHKHAVQAHSSTSILSVGEPAPAWAEDKGTTAGSVEQLLLKEAQLIYEQIMDRRIEGEDGLFTWISLQIEPSSHKMVLGTMNASFYDGVVGLGVFLSALYRLTGDPELRNQTLTAIRTFRQSLHDPWNPLPVHRLTLGLGTGVAGMVRALTAIGSYLDEPQLKEDVRHLLGQLKPEQIEQDRQLDVFGGAAGLLLTLADVEPSLLDDRLVALAERCGSRLLEKRVAAASGHLVWDNGLGFAPLTGMAHGMAGYAAALLRLSALTGSRVFKEAALEALDYENSLFDASALNWPDLRLQLNNGSTSVRKSFMTGWCSGAPGVGLSRLTGMQLEEGAVDRFQLDIDHAVQFTLGHPTDSGDTLCCGNAGRLDFLVEAAQTLGRPELLKEARARAVQIIERKRLEGQYRFSGSEGGVVFNPAFFHGSAGIGYALLRCCSPDRIFSVLK